MLEALTLPWALVGALSIICAILMGLLSHSAPYEYAPSGGRKEKGKDGGEDKTIPDTKQIAELIRKRRSIFPKDYNGGKVPQEAIEQMLEAANWAPTHGKTEPWRFVVMDGELVTKFQATLAEEVKKNVEEGTPEGDKIYKKLARKAKEKKNVSHLIAICFKKVKNAKGSYMPEWEDISAVACAVQNMHLVATAAGIAAYWSSGGVDKVLASEPVRSLLRLSDDERCLGLFHVGMSDRSDKYRGSRKPWQEKVTWLSGQSEQKQ